MSSCSISSKGLIFKDTATSEANQLTPVKMSVYSIKN